MIDIERGQLAGESHCAARSGRDVHDVSRNDGKVLRLFATWTRESAEGGSFRGTVGKAECA